MDKNCIETFQELNNMQSKIASLFQDTLVERFHYKLCSDKLKKNLEEISLEVQTLRKQNEKLQQNNQELKKVISECIKVFQYLDLSRIGLAKDHEIVTDMLKRILSHNCNTSADSGNDITVKMEMVENEDARCTINQGDVTKEIDAIKDFKLDTNFFFNDKNKGKDLQEKLVESKCNEVLGVDKLFVGESEPFIAQNGSVPFGPVVQETVDPLSEVREQKKNLFSSPVFKDFGIRRQESLIGDENCIDDSRIKIPNEKLFLKKDLFISPLKKPDPGNSVSPKRNTTPPKRARKKLKIDSPRKSPVGQLKKSNFREAEMSTSGFRKLTQTILNIECFKKKTPEKTNNDEKVPCDVDEDDVIMESPKKPEQVLEDIKNKKKLSPRNNYATPTTSDRDLDETYVSSTVLNKCHAGRHVLERIHEETPKRGKSPDSVPFAYKREAVRSRAERMKLPGHACVECDKYYKNALGDDISPGQLREILNKCSRHRDRLSPSHEETPAGYWKPYLTETINTSPNKNDTIQR